MSHSPLAGLCSFSAKGGSAFGMTVARNDDVKLLVAFAIIVAGISLHLAIDFPHPCFQLDSKSPFSKGGLRGIFQASNSYECIRIPSPLF
jgi:hypothetical protein